MIQSGEFQVTAAVISRLSMVVADSFLETSLSFMPAALARALAARAVAVVQTTAFRRRALQVTAQSAAKRFRRRFIPRQLNPPALAGKSLSKQGFPMNGAAQQTGIDTTLKAACRYAMEKGNRFDRGPAYKGHGRKVLSSVGQTARWYEGMGYTKLMEFDDPPVYAVLKRGHHEVHIFQPPDPTIRAWLENDEAALDDPAMRAYVLQKSGLDECDLPSASKPRYFHINEVDEVFIATTDEAQ